MQTKLSAERMHTGMSLVLKSFSSLNLGKFKILQINKAFQKLTLNYQLVKSTKLFHQVPITPKYLNRYSNDNLQGLSSMLYLSRTANKMGMSRVKTYITNSVI